MGSGYGIETSNPVENIYSSAAPSVAMGANAVGSTGGDTVTQPSEVNYCIGLQGIFPSRN